MEWHFRIDRHVVQALAVVADNVAAVVAARDEEADIVVVERLAVDTVVDFGIVAVAASIERDTKKNHNIRA